MKTWRSKIMDAGSIFTTLAISGMIIGYILHKIFKK